MDILNFLKQIGLSQSQLARELDVTPANVNLWVNGKGKPSYDCCKNLLSMGMSVEDLFGVQYNELHNLIKDSMAESSGELKEDEFRLRWMKMMQEWNEQQH